MQCKFTNVLESRQLLLRSTLFAYLRDNIMIGPGDDLAVSGRTSPQIISGVQDTE